MAAIPAIPASASIGTAATGALAGCLHAVLAPDHLGTIVTLSACQGPQAFWLGIRWAAGHLTGMCVIGITLSFVRSTSGAAWDLYEHIMDYAVGFMLVAFGCYFMARADCYFGPAWIPKASGCACHPNLVPSKPELPLRTKALCSGFGAARRASSPCRDHCDHHACGMADVASTRLTSADIEESQPLLRRSEPHLDAATTDVCRDGGLELRGVGASLAGLVQGVACPAGLFGTTLLKSYPFDQMIIFVSAFFIATALSMGTLAMTYGTLTNRCLSSTKLLACAYYASCGLSIVVGVTWVALAASGNLDTMLGHTHSHEPDTDHAVHKHDDHHNLPPLVLLVAPR
eukprot:TRINITY_DN2179_c0_g2_i1.p1 TRINITY_DN2179_c0_g2~~TRINITY_DN2179_c0_g2_i1.p1  ORF type:complete len:344 (-),score=45.76 TRINITY_DN2179_c0_g2_i1:1024-2055(-)